MGPACSPLKARGVILADNDVNLACHAFYFSNPRHLIGRIRVSQPALAIRQHQG